MKQLKDTLFILNFFTSLGLQNVQRERFQHWKKHLQSESRFFCCYTDISEKQTAYHTLTTSHNNIVAWCNRCVCNV